MLEPFLCRTWPSCSYAHPTTILAHREALLIDHAAISLQPVVKELLCLVAGLAHRSWTLHGAGVLEEGDAEDLVMELSLELLEQSLRQIRGTSPGELVCYVKSMVRRTMQRRLHAALRDPARPNPDLADRRPDAPVDPMDQYEDGRPDAEGSLDAQKLERQAWDAKLPSDLSGLGNACAVLSSVLVAGGARAYARAWNDDKDRIHRQVKRARTALAAHSPTTFALVHEIIDVRLASGWPPMRLNDAREWPVCNKG